MFIPITGLGNIQHHLLCYRLLEVALSVVNLYHQTAMHELVYLERTGTSAITLTQVAQGPTVLDLHPGSKVHGVDLQIYGFKVGALRLETRLFAPTDTHV